MPHHCFHDDASLSARLADDVAAALTRRIDTQGSASLVVSGGRTPLPFLRELATRPLAWARVVVLLADERCVALDDGASNQRMVRENLLTGAAQAASLLEIDATAPDAALQWQLQLDALPRPFAAVVLGMGDDGHFASLFPRMPGIAAALDPAQPADVVRGLAPAEPQARLSLNLGALCDTDLLALHVTGPAKLATLNRAEAPGPATDLPARALLRQQRVPLHIYHAP